MLGGGSEESPQGELCLHQPARGAWASHNIAAARSPGLKKGRSLHLQGRPALHVHTLEFKEDGQT